MAACLEPDDPGGGGSDSQASHVSVHPKAPWGPARPRGGPGGPTYSSIASINTSVRDKKNILEVKLEKQEGAKFSLTMPEIESLLKRLNIDSSHFEGVSACPEGRPIVLITLHPSVDVNRFLYRNESYIVKEGVRTTTIRPENQKETCIKITGLHPNTKDHAVLRYLSAHGTISTNSRVIHHVFPGEKGSTLLAGKLNGNRSYFVQLKEPMGSYHIIDGEKVSVKYSGQEWTCARCHQYKRNCPGKAVAKDCTAERILLSTHMAELWERLGYKPDNDTVNEEVDSLIDVDVQVGGNSAERSEAPRSTLTSKYNAVIMRGFKSDTPVDTILEALFEQGLPKDYDRLNLVQNPQTGSLTVENLTPEICLKLTENMNRKRFLNRKIFVTSVVSESPVKPHLNDKPLPEDVPQPPDKNMISNSKPLSAPIVTLVVPNTTVNSPAPEKLPNSEFFTPSGLDQNVENQFVFEPPASPSVQDKVSDFEKRNDASNFPDMTLLEKKRKSEESPETSELSRKEKKLLKSAEKKSKRKEGKGSQNVQVQKTL